MEMNGTRQIPARLAEVWQGLNDPAILQSCIPGCESIELVAEHVYSVVVRVAVGPVKARFSGKLSLDQITAPLGYRLQFEGQGGVVGFAKGAAAVNLAEHGAHTRLNYRVTSQIGGKLAQLGSRLVDSTARKLADEFFAAFDDAMSKSGVEQKTPSAEEDAIALHAVEVASLYWYIAVILLGFVGVFFLILK